MISTRLVPFLLFAFVLLFCSAVRSEPITDLPGYNGPALSMDSGYITLNETTGMNMFYWFIESTGSPSTDPLVLWLQGGPGCSGLIGLFRENGPFTPDTNGGLQSTPLGWTNYANVIFVEAPVGVGFSYSDTPSDYVTNDDIAAHYNYVFLQNFIKKFPQYEGRDLWITGESYAGVYIPTLSDLITRDPNGPLYAQFKGLMAGNPVFSCESLNNYDTAINILYWHGLISFNALNRWNTNNCVNNSDSSDCQNIFYDAYASVGDIEQPLVVSPFYQNLPSLDPDELYQDFCTGNGTLDFSFEIPDNCTTISGYQQQYLNREDVKKAIHAHDPPAGSWTPCSSAVFYTPSGSSMIPYYQRIFAQKPEAAVLVYSGDIDILTVPFGYTQKCIAELDTEATVPWQPWIVNGATAGYVETYANFSYATIKGAGHEAPQYQPLNSLAMFQRFMQTGSLVSANEEPRKVSINKPMSQGGMLRKLGIRV